MNTMNKIVFGNLYYNKEGLLRFYIIGLYRNRQLELLDDTEKRELFPNAGKIFIPPDHSLHNVPMSGKVKYGLYKVEESLTYEPDKPTSLKYVLRTEVRNVKLCEVVPIHVPSRADNLYERFQEGFRFPYEPLPNVLFHTSDDYLIGPLQLKSRGNGDIWEVQDTDFAPCYHNNLKFVRYENDYAGEPERIFTVVDELGPVIELVDIANNERAIRSMLKILRENAEVGELSRRTIQQLGKLGDNGYITQDHLIKRLKRVIHLLNVHTFDQDLMEEIQKKLFELPYMQSYIEQQLELQRHHFQKQLEEEHHELLNQVRRLKEETNRLSRELDDRHKEKEVLEETIRQLKMKTEEKISEIQSNVVDVFVHQLMIRGLTSAEIASTAQPADQKFSVEPTLYTMMNNRQAPVYAKWEDFEACLSHNIRTFDYRWLAQTILGAILFDTPILITGLRALELAQLLAHCAAANQTLTILPEVHSFSLVRLEEQFGAYNVLQEVKALILHNVHLTTAESSLPAFLKLKRWSNSLIFPDLVFLSMDEMDMAEGFMDKFPLSPILDSDNLLKKKLSHLFAPPESCGQLTLDMVRGQLVHEDQDEREAREAFEDWVLEKYGLEPDPWPKELDGWLRLLSLVERSQEERFEWMWQIFQRYWKRLGEEK